MTHLKTSGNTKNLSFKKSFELVNKSFEKRLVFRLGAQAGFYSELNNMFLAVIYCLAHNLKFQLFCSADKNFIEKGWDDYFEPFFETVNYPGLKRYNVRPYMAKNRRFRLTGVLLKKIYNIDFFTQDIFNQLHQETFKDIHVKQPLLNIDGDLLTVSARLIKEVYRYNPLVLSYVKAEIAKLNLPEDFIGIHIRKGDKIEEADVFDVKNYITFVRNHFSEKNIFVYTDDYSVIEEVQALKGALNVYTFTLPTENGYYHAKFIALDAATRREMILKMLLNVEVLCMAKHFLGSFDSNIGMFVGMRKAGKDCYDVLHREWMLSW